MKTLWIAWAVGLVMMLGSAFFLYSQWVEIVDRVKRYKEKQADKPSYWWYLNWLDLSFDVFIGYGYPWNPIVVLIACILGTIIFIAATVQIVMRLSGAF